MTIGSTGNRVAAALVASCIFLVDTFTPLEGAVAVLYVIVVVMVTLTSRRTDIVVAGVGSMVLTVAAYIFSHGFVHVGAPTMRGAVSLAAISITTLLALRNQRATTTLVRSERRYRRIFDSSRMGIVLQDWSGVRHALLELGPMDSTALSAYLAGHPEFIDRARKLARIVDVNAAFRAMVSAEGTARNPESVDDVLSTSDRTFVAALKAFALGEPYHEGESDIVAMDGRVVPTLFAITFPTPEDDDGRVLVFVADNTDRKRAYGAMLAAQAELAHAARVATLGEFAASIAHEVNQPLMAVVTSGDAGMRWLRRPLPDLHEVESSLTRIVAEAHRASAIVTRIRAFLTKAPAPPSEIEVATVVDEACALVERELSRSEVQLRIDVEADLPAIAGNRVELQQVLVNLLVNACQAMSAQTGPRLLAIAAARADIGMVAISVRDSGPGIGEKDLAHLFDPFFTTKTHGMGMGLAICRRTVEAHGGRLSVESELQKGAAFLITLPASTSMVQT